jgi:hypothetical protein
MVKKGKQLSLAETGFSARRSKATRKEIFLSEMQSIIPWSRLESLIDPYYPKAGSKGGRPAMGLSTMLRIHLIPWNTTKDSSQLASDPESNEPSSFLLQEDDESPSSAP